MGLGGNWAVGHWGFGQGIRVEYVYGIRWNSMMDSMLSSPCRRSFRARVLYSVPQSRRIRMAWREAGVLSRWARGVAPPLLAELKDYSLEAQKCGPAAAQSPAG